MKTFLFAPETFNLAETTRMIEVAKTFREDAQCIFMGYSQKFSYLIEDEGFKFHYLPPHLTIEDVQNIMKFDQMKTMKIPFSYEVLLERTQQEIQLMEAVKPDCVIIGSTMSLFISARVKKIPLVYVKPYAYTRAHVESPYFMNNTPSFVKNAVRGMITHLKWAPSSIKRLIEHYHLEEIFRYTIDFLDADLNCITTPEILTKNPHLPSHTVYVGPIFAHLDEPLPLELKKRLEEATVPTIFCSMGSSGNATVIVSLLNNFEGMPVEVISPMKSFLSEEEIERLPKNVHIYDWLPAPEVQKMVTASVLHGGEGTLQTACVSGKPFIGIGLQKEQEYNIARCVDYGNALQIKLSKLGNKQLFQAALSELLYSSRMQRKAEKLQKELSLIDGSKNVRDAVLQLLENK